MACDDMESRNELFFSADTEELKKGCRENDKEMKCLICGETYEKGEIFPFEGRYFDAGKRMKLHLENGKTVTISAPNNGDDKRYISSMTLNGKDHTKNYVTHEDLMNGASSTFKMDSKPNEQRGTKETDFPYSFSNEFKKKK